MDEPEKSTFLAGAMGWELRNMINHAGQMNIYVFADDHMLGFRKTLPYPDKLENPDDWNDPIFLPDLYDPREAYYAIQAIRWGYDEIPIFKEWLRENALFTLVLCAGIRDALDKLIEEINATT